jgi:replication factor A2
MRPLTVKQLIDAVQPIPDAPCKVDGHDLSQVVLVGRVNNITQQSTNVSLCRSKFGTGSIYFDVSSH